MNQKLPGDAFEFYFALGTSRTFTAVAEKFSVSTKTVSRAALREKWNERIADRERKAQERMDIRAVDELVAMRERHLKIATLLQRKGLERLQSTPVESSQQAIRSIAIGLAEERMARGEPTERTAVDFEAIIKREYERWLVPDKSDS